MTGLTKEAFDKTVSAAEKRLGRRLSFRVVNFCPYCMTPFMPVMWLNIEKLLESHPHWGIYVPLSRGVAELLEYHILIHPICVDCAGKLGDPAWREKAEKIFEANLNVFSKVTCFKASTLATNPVEGAMEKNMSFVLESKDGRLTVHMPSYMKQAISPEEVFSGRLLGGLIPDAIIFYHKEGEGYIFEPIVRGEP